MNKGIEAFINESLKKTPYHERQERIKKLVEQRDEINRELSAIQREVDAENTASFNEAMNRYNKEMAKRNSDIFMM